MHTETQELPEAVRIALDADPELAKAYETCVRRQDVRRLAHEAVSGLSRGVHLSGVEPEPFQPLSPEDLLIQAQGDLDARRAYLATWDGKAHHALCRAQDQLKALHAQLDEVKAALARRDGTADAKARGADGKIPAIEHSVVAMCVALRLGAYEAKTPGDFSNLAAE